MLIAITKPDGVLYVNIFRLENRDLVKRSVHWFDQYFLCSRLENRHQYIYWTASVYWARLFLIQGLNGLSKWCQNFGLFPGLLAELSEQDREISQMVAFDTGGGTATSACPSWS